MIVTSKKRKYIVIRVWIERLERAKPVEIRLPSNVKKVTGLLATAIWKNSGD